MRESTGGAARLGATRQRARPAKRRTGRGSGAASAPSRRSGPTAATIRKQQAREKVIAVARDLFLERGFDETPIREIVARCGVSMRTFFRYFPSKEDLGFPRAEEGTRRLRELLEQHRRPDHPLLGLRDALVELAAWYDEMREEFLKEWRYESRSKTLLARGVEIEARNQQVIADALEATGIGATDAAYLASVVFGGIRANLEHWFEGGCEGPLIKTAESTLVLLEALDGIPRFRPERPGPRGAS